MELSSTEHREIEEAFKENDENIFDKGYGDYYGYPVYKIWADTPKGREKVVETLVDKYGFAKARIEGEACMIVILEDHPRYYNF